MSHNLWDIDNVQLTSKDFDETKRSLIELVVPNPIIKILRFPRFGPNAVVGERCGRSVTVTGTLEHELVVNCITLTNSIKLIDHSRNELIYTVRSLLLANPGKSISGKHIQFFWKLIHAHFMSIHLLKIIGTKF